MHTFLHDILGFAYQSRSNATGLGEAFYHFRVLFDKSSLTFYQAQQGLDGATFRLKIVRKYGQIIVPVPIIVLLEVISNMRAFLFPEQEAERSQITMGCKNRAM